MTGLRLDGIFPPITTPFDQNGEVDYDGLRRNITRYNESGLKGYVAFGSNGEAVHLSSVERARILETVKSTASPDMTVIAGVNELSTAAAIQATREAAEGGADAALVIAPYYYKAAMTQATICDFYIDVAAQSPIPVLIYNVPQNTGVVVESATIAALSSRGNIAGVKDSAGNMGALAETLRRAAAGFSVLVGSGSVLYPGLMMGAVGAVLAVACVAPKACVDLFAAVQESDQSRARELQNRIAPLSHLVTADLGVAGLKAAMQLAGFVGGPPRRPLSAPSETNGERLRNAMRESGLFPELG